MRIRSVKPDFWKDRTTGRWACSMKLLYVGLWCFADDDGRFEWEPHLMRSELFPYGCDFDLEATLEKLLKTGRVVRYDAGGQVYGSIPTFSKHQHPDKKRSSELPAYSQTTPRPTPDVSTSPPRPVPDDSPLDRDMEMDRDKEESTFARSPEKLALGPPSLPDAPTGPEAPAQEPEAPETPPPTPFAAYLRETWADSSDVPKQTPSKLAGLEAGWSEAYPGVNLLAEAKKARAWQLADPARRRKPRALRFLANWLSRSQQDASRGGNGHGTAESTGSTPAHKSAVLKRYPPPEHDERPRGEMAPEVKELFSKIAKGIP